MLFNIFVDYRRRQGAKLRVLIKPFYDSRAVEMTTVIVILAFWLFIYMIDCVMVKESFGKFRYLLKLECERARRYMYFFSILIVENDQADVEEIHPRLENLISHNIRESDLIGQDELQRLLILLPHAETQDAYGTAERIRNLVEKKNIALEDREDRLTVRIGGACFPTDTADSEELFLIASEMLQTARLLGGNRVYLPGICDLGGSWKP